MHPTSTHRNSLVHGAKRLRPSVTDRARRVPSSPAGAPWPRWDEGWRGGQRPSRAPRSAPPGTQVGPPVYLVLFPQRQGPWLHRGRQQWSLPSPRDRGLGFALLPDCPLPSPSLPTGGRRWAGPNWQEKRSGGTCSVTHLTLRGDRATRRELQPPGPMQLVDRGPRLPGVSGHGTHHREQGQVGVFPLLWQGRGTRLTSVLCWS